MEDPDALFARRFGLEILGRNDWWNVPEEMTDYEWELQKIAQRVDPIGIDRDDLRSARHTLAIISAVCPGMNVHELSIRLQNLQNYAEINPPDNNRVRTPEEAEAIKRQRELEKG